MMTDGRMTPLLWGPPAAFELCRVPGFLAPLLSVFEGAVEQWEQFYKLRASISHLRSQEVIAAAGGGKHLTGAVREHWWQKDDARESTLTSKIEVTYRSALREANFDFNIDVMCPNRAATLVVTITRLVDARTKRLKRKWKKKKG